MGNLRDTEPEKKNHLNDQPEIAERLLGLHHTWIVGVEEEYEQQYPNRIKMY